MIKKLSTILNCVRFTPWYQLYSSKKPIPKLLQILQFIFSGAGVDKQTYYGRRGQPIHHAVAIDNEVFIQMLIKMGANIDAPCSNVDNRTALNLAVCKQNIFLTQMLIKAGANVNNTYNRGRTALYDAMLHRNQVIVDELMQGGANYESLLVADKDGYCFKDIFNSQIVNSLNNGWLNTVVLASSALVTKKVPAADVVRNKVLPFIYGNMPENISDLTMGRVMQTSSQYKKHQAAKKSRL